MSAKTLDIALAPDGSTPTAVAGRQNVLLNVPGVEPVNPVTQTIRADGVDAKGEPVPVQCRYSSWPSNNGPNTSVLRDSNAFVHFDVGFSAFGFDAGAQSGASTYVQSHWKFGSSANHYLCGSENDISHAHRIFAGFG